MATMTVSELRANLREAIERVRSGEELRITRNDEVEAVLVHPSRLRARSTSDAVSAAERLRAELTRRGRDRGPVRDGTLSRDRADELIAWIRSGRERR